MVLKAKGVKVKRVGLRHVVQHIVVLHRLVAAASAGIYMALAKCESGGPSSSHGPNGESPDTAIPHVLSKGLMPAG